MSAHTDPAAFRKFQETMAARFEKYRAAVLGTFSDQPAREAANMRLLLASVCAGQDALAQQAMRSLFPESHDDRPLHLAPVEPLSSWSTPNGVDCKVAVPPYEIAVPATALNSQTYRYQTEPALFASLNDASWVPSWDFVIAGDDAVIADSGYLGMKTANAHRPHAYFASEQLVVFHSPPETIFHDAEALFISMPRDGHIGHWLIDFLPRLKAREHAGQGVKLAVPSTIRSKHLETLELCGIARETLILCDPEKRHRFRTLHVYQAGAAMPPNPIHVAYVRERLSAHKPAPTSGRRLFTARRQVDSRQVVNGAEFEAFLKDERFVTVDVAALSIAEQRAAFADAEIILGALGTDLLALYFAPPGCRVIPMTDDIKHDPFLPQTCFMLGMEYEAFICTAAGRSRTQLHKKDFDLLVDCDQLRRRIKAVGAAH